MKKTLITNVEIVNPDQAVTGDVLFSDTIEAINPDEEAKKSADFLIDGTGKQLFPGVIDPHVHVRTPGLEHKEDFYSGSCAAAAGGVTTIFDMPNTIPPVLTNEILNEKRQICGAQSVVNFGLFFGAAEDNLSEIQGVQNVPGTKMFLNDTTGNLKMDDDSKWGDIFRVRKKVAMHAEGDTFARAVEVWQEVGAPCEIHLVHTVLRQEVELVRELKKSADFSDKVTCEVCPHHLLFTKDDVAQNPYLRMKPELATKDDQAALWEGIEDGTIDFFATDHAPHKPNEKAANPPAFGVPGVQELFPIMYTEFVKRSWSLNKLANMLSQKAAQTYHLSQKGKIATGMDADLVLIDPKKSAKISLDTRLSKADWTPYENYESAMTIETTFVRGQEVFDGTRIVVEPGNGKEISW